MRKTVYIFIKSNKYGYSYIILMKYYLLLVFIVVFLVSCSNNNLKNFSYCQGDNDTNEYIEFSCQKVVNNSCIVSLSDYKPCNLTDLTFVVVGYSSLNPSQGNFINISAFVVSRGPSFNDNFGISFYVNISYPDGSVVNELISRQEHSIVKVSNESLWGSNTVWKDYEGYHYGENGFVMINASYKIKGYGFHQFYEVLDEDNKIIEANENNNFYSRKMFVNPVSAFINITGVFNDYNKTGSIDKNVFDYLKKVVYCNSIIDCDINTFFITKKEIKKIKDYLIIDINFTKPSNEEFSVMIDNFFNNTYCFNKADNKLWYDEYYKIDNPYRYEEVDIGRIYDNNCNDFNISYKDTIWRYKRLSPNPGLTLMKIESNITQSILINAINYYNKNTIYNMVLNYSIFKVNDNYIIHTIETDAITIKDKRLCYDSPLFYEVYKVNKEDKILTRINTVYTNETINNCDKKDITPTLNNIKFSYNLSIIKCPEFTDVKKINLIGDEYIELLEQQGDNLFDNMLDYTINGNNVELWTAAGKGTPCNNVKYYISKEKNDIHINREDLGYEGACVQVVSSDCLDIKMTLPIGKYNIYMISMNKSIEIK